MRIFRTFLSVFVAGATFLGLNALAVRNGYPDRLDMNRGAFSRRECLQKVHDKPDTTTNKINYH